MDAAKSDVPGTRSSEGCCKECQQVLENARNEVSKIHEHTHGRLASMQQTLDAQASQLAEALELQNVAARAVVALENASAKMETSHTHLTRLRAQAEGLEETTEEEEAKRSKEVLERKELESRLWTTENHLSLQLRLAEQLQLDAQACQTIAIQRERIDELEKRCAALEEENTRLKEGGVASLPSATTHSTGENKEKEKAVTSSCAHHEQSKKEVSAEDESKVEPQSSKDGATPDQPKVASVDIDSTPVHQVPEAPIKEASQVSAVPEIKLEKERIEDESDYRGSFVEHKGAWKGKTAGGCVNHDTFLDNPQFFLRIREGVQVHIKLTVGKEIAEEEVMGIYVMCSAPNGMALREPTDVVVKSGFEEAHEIEIVLALGSAEKGNEPEEREYVIIPCTFDPDVENKFTVSCRAEGGEVYFSPSTRVREWDIAEHGGKWEGTSAGGCRNYETCLYNPHFRITADAPGKEAIEMELQLLQEKEDFCEIGMYVFEESRKRKGRLMEFPDLHSKSNFSSETESTLKLSLQPGKSFVVVPCTFEPNFEGHFRMRCISTKKVSIVELGEDDETADSRWRVKGEWAGGDTGGCLNHASWVTNPQYLLHATRSAHVTVKLMQKIPPGVKMQSIGAYVLRGGAGLPGFKKLVLSPADLVTKAPFIADRSTISQVFEVDPEHSPYVILPCSFKPGYQAEFTLVLSEEGGDAGGSEEGIFLDRAKEWQHAQMEGAWTEETAGGCFNCSTWRNNTQCRLLLKPGSSAQVSLRKRGSGDSKYSMGIYILRPSPGEGKVVIAEDRLLTKSPFRRAEIVTVNIDVPATAVPNDDGFVEYNVLPCTFKAGTIAEYLCEVHSDQEVRLEKTGEHLTHLQVEREWTEISSGGCINNATWINNHHFLLAVMQEMRATIVLRQEMEKGEELKHIGLYLTRGDEWGMPVVESPDDVLSKTLFEDSMDVAMEVVLKPSAYPYIVTPSTYYPGKTGKFTLELYAKPGLENEIALVEGGTGEFQVLKIVDEGKEEGFETLAENSSAGEVPEDGDNGSNEENKATAEHNKATSSATVALEEEGTEQSQEDETTTSADSADTTEESIPVSKLEKVLSEVNEITTTPPPPPPPPSATKAKYTAKQSSNHPEKGLFADIRSGTTLKKTAPISTPANSSAQSLFSQIRGGIKLKKTDSMADAVKVSRKKVFLGFDMDKITARRSAIQMSDEEDETEWNEDDWA